MLFIVKHDTREAKILQYVVVSEILKYKPGKMLLFPPIQGTITFGSLHYSITLFYSMS